jgi:hypothetical protein
MGKYLAYSFMGIPSDAVSETEGEYLKEDIVCLKSDVPVLSTGKIFQCVGDGDGISQDCFHSETVVLVYAENWGRRGWLAKKVAQDQAKGSGV